MYLKISKIHTLVPWLLHSGLKSLYGPMLFSSLSSHIFLVLYPSIVLSYVAQNMVYFSSLTWMTVVQSLLSLCLMPILLTRNITFTLLTFFLKQKCYNLCVGYGSTVQSSAHSIQVPKLYSQQNLWHQMRDMFTSISPKCCSFCCFFHLEKCCRNLAVKQKNITEIFFCLTGA